MKKFSVIFVLCFTMFLSVVAMAADEVAPDFGMSIMALFAAFKDKASLAVILMAVFQVLKTVPVTNLIGKLGASYQRLILAIISVGASIIASYQVKQNWISAVVEGLVVAGGAMLIYDAIREMKKPQA